MCVCVCVCVLGKATLAGQAGAAKRAAGATRTMCVAVCVALCVRARVVKTQCSTLFWSPAHVRARVCVHELPEHAPPPPALEREQGHV